MHGWQRTTLLHGDIGFNDLFVEGKEVTGLIDWGNRGTDDPIWDLVTFDWEGGRDFQGQALVHDLGHRHVGIMDERLPLYTVVQPVPWAARCHERGHKRPLRVLTSVVRIARDRLDR